MKRGYGEKDKTEREGKKQYKKRINKEKKQIIRQTDTQTKLNKQAQTER